MHYSFEEGVPRIMTHVQGFCSYCFSKFSQALQSSLHLKFPECTYWQGFAKYSLGTIVCLDTNVTVISLAPRTIQSDDASIKRRHIVVNE